jgi:hypothetical protein
MDVVTLDSAERGALLRHLAAERAKAETSSAKMSLDVFIIKVGVQEPVTLARVETFELLRLLPPPPANGLDSVKRKLWDALG